jgi:hypothetical protein
MDADAVEPEERVLNANFEKVWRAVQLAMAEYPIRVNNQEGGLIETEAIKSDQGFRVPGRERLAAPSGRRYRLIVRVYSVGGAKDRTRVNVRKSVDKQKDFFSPVEKAPSDGLEELAVMYRVERELLIEQAAEKSDGSSQDSGGKDLDL